MNQINQSLKSNDISKNKNAQPLTSQFHPTIASTYAQLPHFLPKQISSCPSFFPRCFRRPRPIADSIFNFIHRRESRLSFSFLFHFCKGPGNPANIIFRNLRMVFFVSDSQSDWRNVNWEFWFRFTKLNLHIINGRIQDDQLFVLLLKKKKILAVISLYIIIRLWKQLFRFSADSTCNYCLFIVVAIFSLFISPTWVVCLRIDVHSIFQKQNLIPKWLKQCKKEQLKGLLWDHSTPSSWNSKRLMRA